MELSQFLKEVDELTRSAAAGFSAVKNDAELEAQRVKFLGAKNGLIKATQKSLGQVSAADRPAAGKRFNELKQFLEQSLSDAQQRLTSTVSGGQAPSQFDVTLPGKKRRLGRLHPITQTIDDLMEIMGRLGFSVAEGPEVEDEWHNFEALNIPENHPARDPLENFYLGTAQRWAQGGAASGPPLLLRSQTSTVQIRVMENRKPPIRIISLGRVYRPDTADATHFPMFHQMEGLLIDRHVTMADLKSVLRLFARSYFGGEVHIRFRPSFFPFTEPSVEVDMSWNDSWIEMGGAGMVDPNVLKAVGYDPDEFVGFAFGLGVERVCARRHQIADIREFYRNDVRFLEQFC